MHPGRAGFREDLPRDPYEVADIYVTRREQRELEYAEESRERAELKRAQALVWQSLPVPVRWILAAIGIGIAAMIFNGASPFQ